MGIFIFCTQKNHAYALGARKKLVTYVVHTSVHKKHCTFLVARTTLLDGEKYTTSFLFDFLLFHFLF
jgi:hypothetical protein